MSFMNKVKNFFYEDIEEEVDDPGFEEQKKKFNPFKKEPKEEKIITNEEEKVDVKQEANNDLSERELFKAERTFNFPMDLGDEIFDEEPKEVKKEDNIKPRTEVVKEPYTRSIYHNISKEEPNKEEKKKFRPSPVISPVYGILDKNYTVDDVVDVDKTKEFSLDKKIVDFDSVRKRAYKDLDDELEKTMNNDIFYNLDEKEPEEEEEQSVIITYDDEEETPIQAEEVKFKEEEVKEIIPEEPEITVEEQEEDDIAPDVKIETPKKTRRSKATKEETEKEDLFNLIDNMYSENEEEEDE